MYMGHVMKDLLQEYYKAIWDHFRDNGYVTGLSDNEVRLLTHITFLRSTFACMRPPN
jgi:hypothetical protein